MRGYKALSWDMKAMYGNRMQYELGKTYSVDGKIIPCINGFHFCGNIEDLNCYCDIAESRIFEVEVAGRIKKQHIKYAAEKIRLVRELTKQEISDYFKENYKMLCKSKNEHVRIAVAKQGYGLDKLICDKNFRVRTEVAKQGYGLDILVYDEDPCVRYIVAERGYGLDVLIKDRDSDVRRMAKEVIRTNKM